MSMTAKRPSKTNKEKALKAVAQEDNYLDGPTKPARFDLDARVKRALSLLSSIAETDDGSKVFERSLVTEALLDLFDKYEKGNGKYSLNGKFKFDE